MMLGRAGAEGAVRTVLAFPRSRIDCADAPE